MLFNYCHIIYCKRPFISFDLSLPFIVFFVLFSLNSLSQPDNYYFPEAPIYNYLTNLSTTIELKAVRKLKALKNLLNLIFLIFTLQLQHSTVFAKYYEFVNQISMLTFSYERTGEVRVTCYLLPYLTFPYDGTWEVIIPLYC